MSHRKETILVQSGSFPRHPSFATFLEEFDVIETSDLLTDLASASVTPSGIILSSSHDQLENIITAIRKSLKNTWLPIAIIAEDEPFQPLGCRAFREDQFKNLNRFLTQVTKPKVLIVEDEEDLQDILSQALSKQYDLTIHGDGLAGLEAGLNESFDVILTDYNLPGMNGDELINKLRNANIDTPIILITAFNKKELELKSLSAGANEYLTKPVSINAIRKNIIEALIAHDQKVRLMAINDQVSWDEWSASHQKKLKQ